MKIIKKYFPDLSLAFFFLIVFVILPLVNFHTTIDSGLAPRFFITSLFLLLYSIFIFLSAKKMVSISSDGFKIFVIAGLMLLWMLLSIFQSVNKGDAFLEWFRLAEVYCFLVVAFFVLSASSNPLKLILRASVFAVFIFVAYGVQQFVSILPELVKDKNIHVNEFVTSSLANKNFFSEVLVLLLPFLVYGFTTEKGFWRGMFIDQYRYNKHTPPKTFFCCESIH